MPKEESGLPNGNKRILKEHAMLLKVHWKTMRRRQERFIILLESVN